MRQKNIEGRLLLKFGLKKELLIYTNIEYG